MRDTELPMDAEDETSDATYWYIWTETRQIGPIFLSRLRQMAHQGKLAVDDKVRRGTTGEWVRAGNLKDVLFPTVANLDATAEQETAVNQLVEPQSQESGVLAKLVSSIHDRIEGVYDEIKYGIADRLSSIRAVVSWMSLIGVAIALIVVAMDQIPFDWFITTDPITTYSSIWEELKGKRSDNASPAEWETFAANSRRELAPIIKRMERAASTDNRMSQQLLWAGRDYLTKMLDDARNSESPSELKFAEHLQRAKWLMAGKDINGMVRFSNRYPAQFAFASDMTTTLFGIAFLIVDVGLVLWFLRRRRNSK